MIITSRLEAARECSHGGGQAGILCVPSVRLGDEPATFYAAACKLLSDTACVCKSSLSPTRYCHSCIRTPPQQKGWKGGGAGMGGGGTWKRGTNLKVVGDAALSFQSNTFIQRMQDKSITSHCLKQIQDIFVLQMPMVTWFITQCDTIMWAFFGIIQYLSSYLQLLHK